MRSYWEAPAELGAVGPDAPPPSLLPRIILYGAARGIVKALIAGRGVALAILLGPTLFGAWAIFRLAMPFAAFASLGVQQGLEFEVARDRWSEETPASHEEILVARTALGYTLAAFGVIGLAFLVASFAVSDRQLAMGMRALGIALPLRQLWLYALVYLRSRGQFRRFGFLEVADAALHAVLTVLFAFWWGLAGAFAGFVLASLGSVLLLGRSAPFRPMISGPQLRRLLRIGLPLSLVLITSTLLATADRWIVAAWGGTRLLGVYAFAVAVAGLAATLVWVVRTVIYPDVYAAARRRGVAPVVRQLLGDTLLPFAWLYPPLLGVAALVLRPVVHFVVPQYVEAIAPAQLLLFEGVALGFISLGSLGVVAGGRQQRLPVFSTFAFLLNVGLSLLALGSGLGLEGVAAGALLSRSAYAFAVLWLMAAVAGIAKPGRLVAVAFAPAAYCAAVVYLLGRLVPGSDAGSFALSAGLYAALLVPLAPSIRTALAKLRRQPHSLGR